MKQPVLFSRSIQRTRTYKTARHDESTNRESRGCSTSTVESQTDSQTRHPHSHRLPPTHNVHHLSPASGGASMSMLVSRSIAAVMVIQASYFQEERNTNQAEPGHTSDRHGHWTQKGGHPNEPRRNGTAVSSGGQYARAVDAPRPGTITEEVPSLFHAPMLQQPSSISSSSIGHLETAPPSLVNFCF